MSDTAGSPTQKAAPARGPQAPEARSPSARASGPTDRSRVQGLLLAAPRELDVTVRDVLLAVGIGILGLLAIGFPADLFNRTLRHNYHRLARVFPWIRTQVPASAKRELSAFFVSCVIAGAIGSLQKAREWSTKGAIVVAASVTFGYLVNTAVHEAASRMAGTRLGLAPRRFRVFPGALPLVAAFVGLSYVGHLQPAYLYGNLSGTVDSSGNPPPARLRALQVVVASIALMTLGMVCWVARGFVSSPLASSLLAGCFVVAISRLAFGLVPIAYFEGAAVAAHSRPMWAALYAPVLALFALLILFPAAKGAPTSNIAGAALLPFLAFAALSVGLWSWFRWTRGGADDPGPRPKLATSARRP